MGLVFPFFIYLEQSLSVDFVLWVRDFRNFRVGLTERRLGHIFYRHPELRNKSALILEAVSEPDELYLDPGGGYHAVKMVERAPADFLVVVYVTVDEEGDIRTAYYISKERKERRYRWFRRLRP